jgi:16S rRNA A1518/A1519 N6-dimethyltransferase RsmA/KsgA/DIM1 with predicted DNA glycosylase/AP lyase activity
MNQKNKHSPVIVRFSKHKNLLDFGFKNKQKNFSKNLKKTVKSILTQIIWLNLLNNHIVMLE